LHFKDVDDSVASYLPHLPQDGKEEIGIRDLLNMRSVDATDDDPTSPGNKTRLDASTDWMQSVYAVPMKAEPGKQYIYVSISAFLVGAIIEDASRMPLDQFAFQNLFAPLGIGPYQALRPGEIPRHLAEGAVARSALATAAMGFDSGFPIRGPTVVAAARRRISRGSLIVNDSRLHDLGAGPELFVIRVGDVSGQVVILQQRDLGV